MAARKRVWNPPPTEDPDDGSYEGRGSNPFKSIRPSPRELKEDQTAFQAAKRTVNPHATLSTADKALRGTLHAFTRRPGVNIVPGNRNPPYPQVPVVSTCDTSSVNERLFRLSRPKEERFGPVGRVESFNILPGTIAFAREKEVRTSMLGYPDTQVFSNHAGLTSEDRLIVVGINIIPVEASESKSSVVTVAHGGAGIPVPHTGDAPIYAWSRVIAKPKPLVTINDDGEAVPYHQIEGHDPMTLHPNLASFFDVDVAVKAAEIEELLHALFEEQLFGAEMDEEDDDGTRQEEEGEREPADDFSDLLDEGSSKASKKKSGKKPKPLNLKNFFEQAEAACKAKAFNDEGYDSDSKHPIEFYAAWSALELGGSAVMQNLVENKKQAWAHLNTRMQELLDAENDHPDMQVFTEAYGDDVDHTGEDAIRNIIQKLKEPQPREQMRLWRAVKQQKNNALMEQHSFVLRRTIGTAMNTVQPGKGDIDLMR